MTAPDRPDEHALRDKVRDTIHAATLGCDEYHAADCQPCTTRAEALMAAAVQPALDAKDAEIKRLRLRERMANQHARRTDAERAEADARTARAEARYAELDAMHLRSVADLTKRAEDAEAEAARLTRELAQARADLGRYDHYATQIGAKELNT